MADAPARFKDLCLDARDHQAMADWWCAALGYVRGPRTATAPARPSLWLDRRVTALAWALLGLVLAVWVARFFGAFGGPAPVRSLAAPLLSGLVNELRR